MAKSPFGLCPACKKKFLAEGLKNHIINSAKGEAFKIFNELLDENSLNALPRLLSGKAPNLGFYRKNLKKKTTFQF